MTPRPVHEHEFEPQHGLPERLPADERVLWQGSPHWSVLARRVFHLRVVALYFGVLLLWRLGEGLIAGHAGAELLQSLGWLLATQALGLALLALLAWLTARTTVYTLTDRRVVMRIGIVLTVTYNLPLARIDSADVHDAGGGCVDIALTLERGTRIAWLHLWPHVRPWHLRRPQPMLRALPQDQAVLEQLQAAWRLANPGIDAKPTGAASEVPQPAFAAR